MSAMRAWSLLGLAVTIACSSTHTNNPPDAGTTRGDYDPTPFGGTRPTKLYVPSTYADSKPAPLLILLHGFGFFGLGEEYYLGLLDGVESRGMLYAHPDGLLNANNERYWNATDACCDIGMTKVDDSKYLTDLVTEIGTRYKVDPKRVYFAGHSNGGFMSYRMACDHADRVAGIMSLAGESWLDTTKCAPSAPVAVLQVQGTSDEVINYDGGSNAAPLGAYPGAKTTVATWATYNGCSSTTDTSAPPLDLESTLPGAETTVTKYASACKANGQVELWSIQGGAHVPKFGPAFAPALLDWLMAHPKP